MKKFSIFFFATTLLTVMSALPVSAQIGEMRNNFAIGFNAGVNLNKVSFNPSVKQNNLPGATGGLTARYISEKYFSMICGAQLELNISQRGWDERFETTDANGLSVKDPTRTYTRKLTYVDIPFLAHLAFGKDNGFQFFLHAGPQIGFLLGKGTETMVNIDTENLTNTQKALYGVDLDYNFDYGIAGGGGLELRSRKLGNFIVEGRYYFALSDFYRTSKKDYFARAAHSTITVKLTYLFDLTK